MAIEYNDGNRTVGAELGRELAKRFELYDSRYRKAYHPRALKNYMRYKGIHDSDTKFDEDSSQAYPRDVRVKVELFVSKMMSMLFPKEGRNFALAPRAVVDTTALALQGMLDDFMENNQQFTLDVFNDFVETRVSEATNELENIIVAQMSNIGSSQNTSYESLVRKAVRCGVINSFGVLEGPLTAESTGARVNYDDPENPHVETFSKLRPYYRFLNVYGVIPDITEEDMHNLSSGFVTAPIAKRDVERLESKEDQGYLSDSVAWILSAYPDGDYQVPKLQEDIESARGTEQKRDGQGEKRYTLKRFYGYMPGKLISGVVFNPEDDEGVREFDIDPGTEYRVIIEFIANAPVRVLMDPFPSGINHLHAFVFEDDEATITGESLPEIMGDTDDSIQRIARQIEDNAYVASGPMYETDVSVIDTDMMGGDMRPRPRKVIIKDSRFSRNGDTRKGVSPISADSHVNELLGLLSVLRQQADNETLVTRQDGADLPGEAMRTSMNASLLNGQSSLPFKEIVSNFDRFTVSVLNSLVAWNKIYNPDVPMDVEPVVKAMGVTSLISQEVRAYQINALVQSAQPEDWDELDRRAVWRERLRASDLDSEAMLVSETEASSRRKAREDQAQAERESQRRLVDEQVKSARASQMKDLSQAQKNMDAAQASRIKAYIEAAAKAFDPEEVYRRANAE